MDQRQILIVANQTAGGEHLREEVRKRLAAGPCRFTLLVPATPAPATWTWQEGEAHASAERRMEVALKGLKDLGADVDGVVGDEYPIDAIEDLVRDRSFDEIIVSTLPPGISRWLKQDLPHRIERHFGVPVTHVIGEAEHDATT